MSKIKSILMWVAVVAFIGFWVWETELKDIGYASLESKA